MQAIKKSGIETDGSNIYLTDTYEAGRFYKYDMDGNFISTFKINLGIPAGSYGIMDLAYDGRYFWGGTNRYGNAAWGGNKIFKFDLQANPPALLDSIVLPRAQFNMVTVLHISRLIS